MNWNQITTINDQLKKVFKTKEDPWIDSDFKWMQFLPSARKGKIGKELVMAVYAQLGFTLSSGGKDCDFRANGLGVEVKTSMEWSNGLYRFQQIRDQEYDMVVMVGLGPSKITIWSVPKKIIMEHAIPQHMGEKSKGDTYWLTVKANDIPSWLEEYEVITLKK